MDFVKDPRLIEQGSFEIISRELGERGFGHIEGNIIKRIIHTTADFEYADITQLHPQAIEAGMRALGSGCKIYTDTQMIMSGINKRTLGELGGSIVNMVHEPEAARIASIEGITRSMAAMRMAAGDESIKIFAIGNAPTALFTLKSLIEEGIARPELVIGVPVGFVGAAESKEEIKKAGVPYIVTSGRKGGSTVAAAIVNALLYSMMEKL